MQDFFRHQDEARRNTLKLLFFFALAALLVAALVAAVIYVLFSFDPQRLYHAATPFNLSPASWDPLLFARIALAVLFFILLCTLYKYLLLKNGGGSLIAQMCGGRPVPPDSADLRERRLLNIVEEMALASGVTVPTVYLLDREEGINAFAAGFSQEDAVIGVTRGALLHLAREELQGVVAHEFSHILHGDMLINIRLQGVLHGIVALGLLGEILVRSVARGGIPARSRSGSGRQGGGGLVFLLAGLALYVLGYAGALAGKMMKSAIARQREFLADAAAVQFTRNPAGLAGALKKIGGLPLGARIRDSHAAELSHIYFGNAMAESWWGWLSTHPPLPERIRRLEPGFQGDFPRQLQPVAVEGEEGLLSVASRGAALPAQESRARDDQGIFLAANRMDQDLAGILAGPSPAHLLLAREMLDNLPAAVRSAARNPFSARAVVCALLLARDAALREAQRAALARQAEARFLEELDRLLPEVAAMAAGLRLPLLDLLLPALKTLSPEQYRVFRQDVVVLIGADRRVDLFELGLQHVLLRRLDAHFGLAGQGRALPPSFPGQELEEISCVLSLLARHGSTGERPARIAFMRGVRVFARERKRLEYLSAPHCSLQRFAAALVRLEQARAADKELLLAACLAIVVHDGQVTVPEAELFRVIVEVLGLPAPPWLTLDLAQPPPP